MTISEKYAYLIGERFGHVVVVEIKDYRVDGKVIARVKCDCGNEKLVRVRHLVTGATKTCGKCSFTYQSTRDRCSLKLEGRRFGKLIAMCPTDKRDGSFVIWKCKCDCGNETFASSQRLTSGRKKSCGECGYKTQRIREACQLYKTPLERKLGIDLFGNIHERCYNTRDPEYYRYGGRGIYICDEWLEDRRRFVKWAIDNGYQKGLTLDRINNNGPYAPWNCRWVSHKVQQNNRRDNHIVVVDGVSHTCSEWADIYGVQADRFYPHSDEIIVRCIRMMQFAKERLTKEQYDQFKKERVFSSAVYRRYFGDASRIIVNDRGNKMIQAVNINQSCTRWDTYFLLPDGYTQKYCKEHGVEATSIAIENRLAGKESDYGSL